MKLIILDRDGVINQESKFFIKNPEEWIALPGSLEAIARFTAFNWKVIVATNQSGIGRRLFDKTTLNAIHEKMRSELRKLGGAIEAIFFCPHHPKDQCECRKPKPGIYLSIIRNYALNPIEVPVVGDSLRDLQAAAIAGCQPWLVRTGNGNNTLERGFLPPDTRICENLADVAERLTKNLGEP